MAYKWGVTKSVLIGIGTPLVATPWIICSFVSSAKKGCFASRIRFHSHNVDYTVHLSMYLDVLSLSVIRCIGHMFAYINVSLLMQLMHVDGLHLPKRKKTWSTSIHQPVIHYINIIFASVLAMGCWSTHQHKLSLCPVLRFIVPFLKSFVSICV